MAIQELGYARIFPLRLLARVAHTGPLCQMFALGAARCLGPSSSDRWHLQCAASIASRAVASLAVANARLATIMGM
jgi:hypothetical protein